MFDYLKIQEKITPESLEALGNEECFTDFSEKEAQQLISYCKSDSPAHCDVGDLNALTGHLSQAFRLVMFSNDSFYKSSGISKAGLEEKLKVIEKYLEGNKPDWEMKTKLYFSGSVLRITKMIFGCDYIDCSVLYILDRVIDEATISSYHGYLWDLIKYSANQGERFYDHFYSLNFQGADKKFEKELARLRSYSDFKRAKKVTRIFSWTYASSGPFKTHRIYKLHLQAPPVNAIYRFSSLIWCGYHLQNYYQYYLLILLYLIPDEESFNVAAADSFFEETDIDWKGYHALTDGVTGRRSKPYTEDIYVFVKQANKYFYNYTDAFFKDLHDKLIFEPVTFYFAVIPFVFFFLSLIQVLQAANIIPSLSR